MKKEKLVIWGASGHAAVIADIIELNDKFEIVGFLDDFNTDLYDTDFCGAPILGGKEKLSALLKDGVKNIILGFGNCSARIDLSKIAKEAGFSLVNAVHPNAVIAGNVKLGEGVVVAAGAVINSGTKIGDNVIINTCASVDHDCIIRDGVHICPGVRLAGSVEIGEGSWIGIGSIVRDKIKIGENSIIGAGSVVVKNIPSNVTAFGVPAQIKVQNNFKDIKNRISDLAIFGGSKMFDEKLHVGRPNIGNRKHLLDRINNILDSCWLTNDGLYVQEFERKIAELIGAKHCVLVCNATIGLEIAIRALGLSGEVIVPSMTFIATAHTLEWQKITPVFCDIDDKTWNIDPHQIEQLITPNTTGIIGVHLFGRPCNTKALQEIASKNNLKLLYDAAHAFGCSHGGKMIGNFGNAEVFSFHATKFFNSLEGGVIATNNDELATKMRLMRNFGFHEYEVISPGTNGKMNEFSAAMGITSLESIDEIIGKNHQNYDQYQKELSDVPGISLIEYDKNERCNFQYVVLDIDDKKTNISRDNLIKVLWAENVIARNYFSPGCHKGEPYCSDSKYGKLSLPITEKVADRLLSLPTGTSMDGPKISKLCDMLKYCIKHGNEISDRLKHEKYSLNQPLNNITMNEENYYEKYWQERLNDNEISNTLSIWSKENLNWHYTFFRNFIGKDILDIGAGYGAFLNYLLTRNKNVKRAVAGDLSSEVIEQGRKRYPNLVFEKESMEKLVHPDNNFDTVFATEIVEHLLDVDQCFAEVHRVLKKGGYFCITTTDFNWLKKIIVAAFYWDKYFYPNTPHIRFFTKKTLVDICKKHGFQLARYKWNKSYFGLMPKGQMIVFKKR